MASGSTIYNFEISLSDTTRGIYETFPLRAAMHSSESLPFLLCRVLAFCLEYKEGLEFTKGLDDSEMPAIWAKDLTGKITDWVEIGTPSAEKLHKASKRVERVVIYTHKQPEIILEGLAGKDIYHAEKIILNSIDSAFLETLSEHIERKNIWELTFSETMLYLNVAGKNLTCQIGSKSIG